MALFKGAGVAMITPFQKDCTVDYDMLKILLERQIANGTDAIIVCGTTGEPATLTDEEWKQVVCFAIEVVKHRVPVIVGTGANDTKKAIARSQYAQDKGADGLLIVSPFYNKATQKGIYKHYESIASEVSLPIIMYNVPSRTGCNILPDMAVALARDITNIVGIKEASGDISQIADLAFKGKGIIDIYAGNDDQIIPILALGGIGVISVLSNVVPKETHDMVEWYLAGRNEEALELQLKYLPLVHELFREVNPIPVKAAMELLGFSKEWVRLPLTELEEEHKNSLRDALCALNLI